MDLRGSTSKGGEGKGGMEREWRREPGGAGSGGRDGKGREGWEGKGGEKSSELIVFASVKINSWVRPCSCEQINGGNRYSDWICNTVLYRLIMQP